MANAWSAGSAYLLQEAGFKAIGTTSAGIAFSHALPDYAGTLPFETALEDTRRICAAVSVPVNMDAENCYGHSADDVRANMLRIVQSGVVGANIEDYSGDTAIGIYDKELAIDRIRAAREGADTTTQRFVLTARSECFLAGHPNAFAESVERVNAYHAAGADCLFVPGLPDLETIRQFVSEVAGPVNVVMGLSGQPIPLSALQDAGVSRISIGGSLARATLGLVRRAATEMLQQGTFSYADGQIPDRDLCNLFASRLRDKN